jgi:peroxiredoxin
MPLNVGERSKDFKLLDWQGKTLSTGDERVHRLFVFYKTTCPTCQLALPFLEELYKLYGEAVPIWGIAQDRAEDVEKFIQRYGLSFPQLIDYPNYEVSLSYSVDVVPTIYLVDPDMKVEFVSQSFVKSEFIRLIELLSQRAGKDFEDIFIGAEVPAFKPG